MSDKSRLSQCVIVELSDGRTLEFSGKAAVFPDDPPLKIVGIRFTSPAELPKGMYFVEVAHEQNATETCETEAS